VSVPHDITAETELWDTLAESVFKQDAEPTSAGPSTPVTAPAPNSWPARDGC
jgi:hypothetical protein